MHLAQLFGPDGARANSVRYGQLYEYSSHVGLEPPVINIGVFPVEFYHVTGRLEREEGANKAQVNINAISVNCRSRR